MGKAACGPPSSFGFWKFPRESRLTIPGILIGAGPGFLSTARAITNRGCPTLRDFRRVGTSDDGIRAWPKAPQLSCGPWAIVVTNEPEVEARGVHPSKNAKGGAAATLDQPPSMFSVLS